MTSLRNLVLLNAVLLLALGFGMAIFWPHSFPMSHKAYQETATIRYLGIIVGGMGLVLYMLRDLVLVAERRRLALGLGVANALIAFVAVTQQIGQAWVQPLGWILILLPLWMAALAWITQQPGSLEDAAAESLPIPDEIRRRWLRQIGEAAVQEERNRLARDLHDSIKQQLFTINVSTAAAQELWELHPERAKAALGDVRQSAREAMVEMQALLHQLQPQALASAGLVEALREQCEALGYRTGAVVSLELGEAIPDDRLPPGAQETLFRIAQETLANVARHARARNVSVWLGREEDSALLRVQDDGQGFDPATRASGMGLRNLYERAESLQGTLEIQSAPGSGTRISVRVPLRPPLPQPAQPRSPIEEERRQLLFMSLPAVIFWLQRPLLVDNQNYIDLAFALFYLLLIPFAAIDIRSRTKSALEASPNAAPATAFALQYRSHRNRIICFLTATWWAPWYWRFDQGWGRFWSVAWLAASLVWAALTIAEAIKLHRTSELRSHFTRRQWSGFFLVLTAGISFLILLSIYPRLWAVFGPQPLEPAEIPYFILGVIVLGYLLTRQPRTEGAIA